MLKGGNSKYECSVEYKYSGGQVEGIRSLSGKSLDVLKSGKGLSFDYVWYTCSEKSLMQFPRSTWTPKSSGAATAT